MVINVNPGDTVRVTFTLTNTGSPVSGIAGDEFDIHPAFMNVPGTDAFAPLPKYSGAMGTNESKVFSHDVVVPSATPGDYNLWASVMDPNAELIFNEIIEPISVNLAGIYSVSISNISVTKV